MPASPDGAKDVATGGTGGERQAHKAVSTVWQHHRLGSTQVWMEVQYQTCREGCGGGGIVIYTDMTTLNLRSFFSFRGIRTNFRSVDEVHSPDTGCADKISHQTNLNPVGGGGTNGAS